MARALKCACGTCRTCYQREYQRRWYASKPRTEEQKRANRERASRWARENREERRAQSKRDRERHPEKVEARKQLNMAVRRGDVQRGPCEGCGTTDRVHGHHDDYSKPLDVRWLCVLCHAEVHRKAEAA